MANRLTPADLARAHDGLCGITLRDGPCSCLVHWVDALQQELDASNRWIEEYGRHDPECKAHSAQKGTSEEGPCDCGLATIKLKILGKAKSDPVCQCGEPIERHGGCRSYRPKPEPWTLEQKAALADVADVMLKGLAKPVPAKFGCVCDPSRDIICHQCAKGE